MNEDYIIKINFLNMAILTFLIILIILCLNYLL